MMLNSSTGISRWQCAFGSRPQQFSEFGNFFLNLFMLEPNTKYLQVGLYSTNLKKLVLRRLQKWTDTCGCKSYWCCPHFYKQWWAPTLWTGWGGGSCWGLHWQSKPLQIHAKVCVSSWRLERLYHPWLPFINLPKLHYYSGVQVDWKEKNERLSP